ncbi:hypothetical protein ACRQ4B_10720 [Curtobacterium sp. SP.BCo]|uniref:hypothetical protein n=1 Tax=Curtobacterium sp. SP.BCo TaxID=3435229 RepID=UPI003F740F7A
MILYQRSINSAPAGMITFQKVFDALNLRALQWLITDLWMTAIPESGLDVLQLENKVTQSDGRGLWVSHGEMLKIVRSCDQMIDGEFLGHPMANSVDVVRPIVRIDFFDSSIATVIIDEQIISVPSELINLLGTGSPQVELATRGSES